MSRSAGYGFDWDDVHAEERTYRFLYSPQITRFLNYQNAQSPKTALDIGCGSGQLTRELYHRGYLTLGVDFSQNAIKHARALTTVSENQLLYRVLDVEQDDLSVLPCQPYGLITCYLVYPFIEDKISFLKKTHELLAVGGIFVLITPVCLTPEDTKKPAVSAEEFGLLSSVFKELDSYQVEDFHYFIGSQKS